MIIIGAGEVGYDLGSMLSQEKHDVVILDRDKEALRQCGESDVLTIEGNATSAQDLQRAGVAGEQGTMANQSIVRFSTTGAGGNVGNGVVGMDRSNVMSSDIVLIGVTQVGPP